MHKGYYLNGPLNIDRTTQSSSIVGPLGDQKIPLILCTVYTKTQSAVEFQE